MPTASHGSCIGGPGHFTPHVVERDRSPVPPQFVAELVHVLPHVKSYASRLSERTADAEDLVQETCRRALESHAQFSPGSNLRGWLLCILRNHHRDRLRRACREIYVGDGIDDVPAEIAEDKPPEPWTSVSEEDAALAMTSLPPAFKHTYVLHSVGGLSYSEIAARLQIPAATVGTRLRRARAWLRHFLVNEAACSEDKRYAALE